MKMFIDINWSASFIVLYATVAVVIAGAIEADQQQQGATTTGSTNSLDSLQCAGFKSPIIGSAVPQQRWAHFATPTQIIARFVPIDDLFEPNPNCTTMQATKRLLSNQIVHQTMMSTVLFTYCAQCSQCSSPGADINRVQAYYVSTLRNLARLLPPSTTLYLFVYDQRIPQRDSSTNNDYPYTDDVQSNNVYWMFIKNAADTTTLQQTQQILAAANGTQCQIQLAQPDTDGSDAMRSFSKTSVLFVSISFIILMVISLAWLVFYYVQRFRYAHAKDRLARRLFNAAKKALTRIPTRPLRAGDVELDADCPVCIEPYCLGDIVRSLPCRHVFHKTCVDPWLLEHRTCPMCKSDILKAFGYNFGHVDDVRGVGDGGGRGGGGGDEHVDSDDRASIDDTHNAGTSASDSVYPFPTMMMMMTHDGDIHDPFSLTPTDESMHAVQQVLHSGNASSFSIIPLTVHSCNIQQSNGTIDQQRQSSSTTLDNDATFTTASEPLSSIQPCTSQSPPPESTMVNGGGRRILLTPLPTSSMAPSTASDDGPTQVHVRSRSLNPTTIVPLSASSIRLKHSASSGRQKPTFRPSTSNAVLARNHSSTDLGSIESL